MIRLRKRSDAKRTKAYAVPSTISADQRLPELPPASDFRTSLILPDLTRRFSLLRTSAGDPLSIDELRSRFAEQRAKGAPHQITKEEEDMILSALGRIRAKTSTIAEGIEEEDAASAQTGRQSFRSNMSSLATYPSSITSSPSSRSNKRYSNNLFSSGRVRDYGYIRSVSSNRSNRSAASIAPTESNSSLREKNSMYSDNFRPSTPEDSAPSSSVASSPNEKAPIVRVTSLSGSDDSDPSPEYALSKALSSVGVHRASMALEQVIREFEEEAEDEIVMPRSSPMVSRPPETDHNRISTLTDTIEIGLSTNGSQSRTGADFEAGTAISPDKQPNPDTDSHRVSPTPFGRPGTTSPTPRLPGYIPGMPRPMTPRDSAFDSDDQRSHSTTPRAMSPVIPVVNGRASPLVASSLASGLLRRDSSASRQTARPQSPVVLSTSFTSRSGNGRFSPEDGQRIAEGGYITDENLPTSSFLGRRVPPSPLSGPAFQPLVVSSRPGTPSNVTWNAASSPNSRSHVKQDSTSSHSRMGSVGTDDSSHTDRSENIEIPKSLPSPLRSPALPDSPNTVPLNWNRPASPLVVESRSSSSLDFRSPLTSKRHFRSPTPTQSRSPTSPTPPSNDSHSSIGARRRSPRPNTSSAHTSSTQEGAPPPLVFSPIVNSSRSSLESEGSSYHSWEGERKVNRVLDMLNTADPEKMMWHDGRVIPKPDPPSKALEDEWDSEDIIRRYAGLTKADFMHIQDTLVSAAIAKTSSPEIHERTPSLRRRRPSTSQSNYSLSGRENRVASPLPQNSTTNSRSPAADHTAKANALLDSVVDSIQSPKVAAIDVSLGEKSADVVNPAQEVSPTTRRNRDLARALFGADDEDVKKFTPPSQIQAEPSSATMTTIIPTPASPSLSHLTTAATFAASDPALLEPASSSSPSTSPSTLRSPRSPQDEAELAREVQRKTEVAMTALRKNLSGQPFSDVNASSVSVSRKRINPGQISNPKLVSATTSVDTIPLPSPFKGPDAAASAGTLNISQRIRKLRGTLRVKATPSEEATISQQYAQPQSPPLPSSASNRSDRTPTVAMSPQGSPSDGSKSQTSSVNQPPSSSPGIKSFMTRFRRQRTSEGQFDQGRGGLSPTSPSLSSLSTAHSTRAFSPQVPAISVTKEIATSTSHQTLSSAASSSFSTHPTTETSEDNDPAVKQLFDAALNLGLDQAAVNDLLSRSRSVTSKPTGWTLLSRNNSGIAAPRRSNTLDRIRASTPTDGQNRPSADESSHSDETIVQKLSIRKRGEVNTAPGIVGQEINAIVRRTIIFPSETKGSTVDLTALTRKNSQTSRRRRSPSAISVQSGRSIHDRVPTPPPPRSPGGRRFSQESSPPVPQVPTMLSARAETLLNLPQRPSASQIEKSNSTYDSLYDMYTGESRHVSMVAPGPSGAGHSAGHDGPGHVDGTRALEVVEMANGETIWSIVNGLRDDDVDSIYAKRTSFASDYSTRENGDSLQVFFKEHARTGSKGSNSSFISRKKPLQNKNRPETKVFYSPSADIGRLIENLSQGMEAGSFNFLPNNAGHSSTPSSFHSDGDTHWTVEERLEHMLGSIKNS